MRDPSALLRSPAVLLLLMLVAVAGCRDDVEPFDPGGGGRVDQGRLTLNPGDDRAPVWSTNGESILYTGEGLAGVDSGPGVLLRLSLESGEGAAVLPTIQSPGVPGSHWLVAPAPRPDSDEIAFVEIVDTFEPHPCNLALTTLVCQPDRSPDDARRPPLREIALRVRGIDEGGALADVPSLALTLEGTEAIPDSPRLSIVRTHPFQQLFDRDTAFTFRASWGPEGDRLALSDGLRILIWTVEAATAEVVPNTQDGVWPAWSPDGEWIAFTRLERADSTSVHCEYLGQFGNVICVQERLEYTIGRHVLTLVRPDGSETVELGTGDEPAWSPDGRALFFRSEGRIWRMELGRNGSVAAGAVSPVPGTEGGREPAVAPDGASLAFARLEEGGYNLWVVPLEP